MEASVVTGKRRGKRVVGSDGSLTVHGKNANGEGSVYQLENGRWVASWTEPGRRYPRQATGKTRDEAITKRAARQSQPRPEKGQTLADIADWWLHKIYKPKVSIDTWHKASERLPRIKRTLGHLAPGEIDYGTVVDGLAELSEEFKSGTVRNYRQTLALICDEAVKLGLAQGNPVRTTDAPARHDSDRPALEAGQVHALVRCARKLRLGAAVVILFLQGWRVSEVLGLAWDDIDFDTGKVQIRRISIYRKNVGRMLKPQAKTDASHGEYWLSPTCVELLKIRRTAQAKERLAAPHWQQVKCEGKPVDLVFTNLRGGLVQRTRVQKAVERAAKAAGIDPGGLGTHGGRRTVVTVMWDEGEQPLDDIAGFVGHADAKTTAGYVKRRRKRPQNVAQRAAKVLDPAAS
jgi:integrase